MKKGKYLEIITSLIEEHIKVNDSLKVEHDVKLIDKDGIKRQIDILVSMDLGSRFEPFQLIIETKNLNRRVEVGVVGSFIDLLNSLNVSNGIIVSAKGFQSGAIRKAEGNQKVLLYRIEETDKSEIKEWLDSGLFEIGFAPLYNHVEFELSLEIELDKKFTSSQIRDEAIIISEAGTETFSEYIEIELKRLCRDGLANKLPEILRNLKSGELPPEYLKMGITGSFINSKIEIQESKGELKTLTANVPLKLKIVESNSISQHTYQENQKDPKAKIITAEFDNYRFVEIENIESMEKQAYYLSNNEDKKATKLVAGNKYEEE